MGADPTAVAAIAGLILVKEIGLPIPVPGDLVILGAGVAASRGELDPGLALAALIVASVIGGVVQFGLLRSVARPAAVRLLSGLGLSERIDVEAGRFRRAGPGRVAAARVTPGIRIVAIAASALAGVGPVPFVLGLTIGNAVFIAGHFALGYAIGEPVVRLVGTALAPLAVVGIGLALVGLVGWTLIRRRGERRSGGRLPAAAAWIDACCPACLALGGAAATAGS
jgi:membrane protein DedA with SNARE-associated domain